MATEPAGPPELVEISEHGNDWPRYCDALYGIFHGDFVARSTKFLGKHVTANPRRNFKGKALTFWHLISEGSEEEERLPDFRRCERIRWPRWLIEGVADGRARWWRESRGRGRRTHIASPDFGYLVVLEELATHCSLITAYPIEQDHHRRKLARRYEAAAEKG